MSRITVGLPIEVPEGEYCWSPKPPFEICSYFDNEGGAPWCSLCDHLDFGVLKYEEETGGVKKPKQCLDLKPIGE